MPFVIKYCPRCIKEARSSIMFGVLLSITAYYFWDYLGFYSWLTLFTIIFLRYIGII